MHLGVEMGAAETPSSDSMLLAAGWMGARGSNGWAIFIGATRVRVVRDVIDAGNMRRVGHRDGACHVHATTGAAIFCTCLSVVEPAGAIEDHLDPYSECVY
mgnify:CR=1 FL=1